MLPAEGGFVSMQLSLHMGLPMLGYVGTNCGIYESLYFVCLSHLCCDGGFVGLAVWLLLCFFFWCFWVVYFGCSSSPSFYGWMTWMHVIFSLLVQQE